MSYKGLEQIQTIIEQDLQRGLEDLLDYLENNIMQDDNAQSRIVSQLIKVKWENKLDNDKKKECLILLTEIETQLKQELSRTQPDRPGHPQSNIIELPNLQNTTIETYTPPILLKANGISINDGQFELDAIDICITAGQIVAIVGENAAGKTTLLKILAGIIRPSSGEISYCSHWNSNQDKHISFLPQNLEPLDYTVKKRLHLELALQGVIGKENEHEVNFIISRFDLNKHQNKHWDELSGGYQIRFMLAKCLLSRPELLFLDEPLANLDINAQIGFLSDIYSLANRIRPPLAIVITSQHISEIESIADHIIYLENGRCRYNDSIDKFEENTQEYVYEFAFANKEMLDEKTIQQKFKNFAHTKLKKNVLFYTIITDQKYNQFLQYIQEQQLPINYFREITHSAKKWFIKNSF